MPPTREPDLISHRRSVDVTYGATEATEAQDYAQGL